MRKAIILLIALLSFARVSFAQPKEFSQVSESKYFTIYSQGQTNLLRLTKQIDINSQYLLLETASFSSQGQLQRRLGSILDAIFLEASDILRMHLYNFKGSIRIYPNQHEFKQAIAGFPSKNTTAYYLQNTNSIYINMQALKPEALGYAVARAIIANYFAVSPPITVQEILAQDVGYHISRMAR